MWYHLKRVDSQRALVQIHLSTDFRVSTEESSIPWSCIDLPELQTASGARTRRKP